MPAPGPPGDDEPLPTVVLLMAEHGGVFLWDRSPGGLGDVLPEALGVSDDLVRRLTEWNSRFEEHASRWGWEPSPPELAADDQREWDDWAREGLGLAHALQHELDALGHRTDVRYAHDGDERPLGERRDP